MSENEQAIADYNAQCDVDIARNFQEIRRLRREISFIKKLQFGALCVIGAALGAWLGLFL